MADGILSFADALLQLRALSQLSQSKMAKALHISAYYVWQLEKGKVEPGPFLLERFTTLERDLGAPLSSGGSWPPPDMVTRQPCVGCGEMFLPVVSNQTHCRLRCRLRRKYVKGAAREKRKRAALRAALRAAQPVQVALAPRPRGVCVFCSKPFQPKRANAIVCSAKCRDDLDKASRTHRKRARLLGVSYESINPIHVFERDGWKCQMCGRATPRRLRGSKNPRAPELDHRIPMALGGGHVWGNVQCSCVFCNQSKGGRRVRGQLSLLGPPT